MVSTLPDISELPRYAASLAKRITELGYSSSGLHRVLGDDGLAALDRHEPAAVSFACHRFERQASNEDDRRLARAVRLLILREPQPRDVFVDTFGDNFFVDAVSAGVIVREPDTDRERFRTAIDIRPLHISPSERSDYLIFSDADASMVDHSADPEHVVGVGAASRSLLQATGTSHVGSVLDLGTGSGVQIMGQWGRSDSITATDVSQRALLFAEATCAAAEIVLTSEPRTQIDFKQGSWFEPVRHQTFDRIIANPPFVVGPPTLRHVYRDSGMELDGATAKLIRGIPEHLAVHGQACVLGAWIHSDAQAWQARVASWIPDHGYRAWVLERDCVDPLHYVGTWIKDESLDPRGDLGRSQSEVWIDYMDHAGVTGIGIGFIAMTPIDPEENSEVVCEEFTQPYTDPLGPEIEEYFRRCAWLDARTPGEILDSRFSVRPGLALEKVSLAEAEADSTFTDVVTRITRTDGPRFSHEIDENVLRIFRGLDPNGLSARDVCEIAELVTPTTPAQNLADEFLPILVDAIRHGLVIPGDLQ
ncbi:methyltransferase [Corynebacterium sp. SFY-K9]|uniref:DUF7782 domain-containing protein n=1 Tax=Corynebacterium sp. SFY-K9 TaxID=3092263 RepID=UPI00298F2894|nr:methyltransferase [Corynebacterium sp. SFY-K9]